MQLLNSTSNRVAARQCIVLVTRLRCRFNELPGTLALKPSVGTARRVVCLFTQRIAQLSSLRIGRAARREAPQRAKAR